MNVTSLAPFRVVHDGTAYRPGDSVDVPAEPATASIDRRPLNETIRLGVLTFTGQRGVASVLLRLHNMAVGHWT
jgi:hypothetical protein